MPEKLLQPILDPKRNVKKLSCASANTYVTMRPSTQIYTDGKIIIGWILVNVSKKKITTGQWVNACKIDFGDLNVIGMYFKWLCTQTSTDNGQQICDGEIKSDGTVTLWPILKFPTIEDGLNSGTDTVELSANFVLLIN